MPLSKKKQNIANSRHTKLHVGLLSKAIHESFDLTSSFKHFEEHLLPVAFLFMPKISFKDSLLVCKKKPALLDALFIHAS